MSILKSNSIILTFGLQFLLALGSFSKTESAFSPYQGKQAYQKIYDALESAKSSINGTIYSWSPGGYQSKLYKVLSEALSRGVQVRLVLHPGLEDRRGVPEKLNSLIEQGAQIKISRKNMHEKFFIVDSEFMVNTSANMSNSAVTRYDENFVFVDISKMPIESEIALVQAFKRQFFWLFHYSKPFERTVAWKWEEYATLAQLPEQLPEFFQAKTSRGQSQTPKNRNQRNFEGAQFVSSRMNFVFKPESQNRANAGIFLKANRRLTPSKSQTKFVQNLLIQELRDAKQTIDLSQNHMYLENVAKEIVKAAKRGVKVRLIVDNQEFTMSSKSRTKTHRVVTLAQQAGVEIEVRVKFYAHIKDPSKWLLNHHKYTIIDGKRLVTGSFNLSTQAEHNQFDNLVLFAGSEYQDLTNDFIRDFEKQWNFNRNKLPGIHDRIWNRDQKRYMPTSALEAAVYTWKELETAHRVLKRAHPEWKKTSIENYKRYNRGQPSAGCSHVDLKLKRFVNIKSGKISNC